MSKTIFVLLSLALVYTSGQGLYENVSDVTVLTEQTFYNRMSAANESLFIVQFYSSWCGHCHQYAPTWQTLAAGVKAWRPYVILAAIDCEDNYELCRSQHVEAYPTFKYYEPFTKKDEMGKELQLDPKERVEVQALKTKILKTTDNIEGDRRPSWMNALNFYKGRIQNEFDKGYEAVVMVVERTNVFAGRMMIMDHMAERHNRPVFRLRAPQWGMPIGRGKAFAVYIYENGELKPMDVGNKRAAGPHELVQEAPPRQRPSKPTGLTESVYQADLDCGLAYMFKREIPCKGAITGNSLTVLQDWLNLLLEYLPMSTPVRNSIEAINEIVKRNQGTVNSDQLLAAAKLIEKDRYLPDTCYKCKGSKPYYRGYPCALWQILHTLTVQLAKKTSDRDEALHMYNTIRAYISTFFMCKVCAKHFKERTNFPQRIISPDELVNLIYEVHNQANLALSGTLTEDPLAPKVHFPPKELCPDCNSKEATLQFLKQFYEPDTSVAFEANVQDHSKGESWLKLQEQQNQLRQGLTPADTMPQTSAARSFGLYFKSIIYSYLLLSFLLF